MAGNGTANPAAEELLIRAAPLAGPRADLPAEARPAHPSRPRDDLPEGPGQAPRRALPDGYDAYRSGRANNFQTGQLALTWKGATGLLGWAGVAPALARPLRAKLGYLFGCRCLRMRKDKEAAGFFRGAAADAGPGSVVVDLSARRLADLAGAKGP
ncbi:MAG TPA: hypothetical protein VM695_00615 [Phycisphaerae bacterium]|nr:hypothetical protein [Phycisphaerae bacterium]